MPDDDIAARLRDIANQMTDVVTIGHEDDPFFSGGEIADVEEAADLIERQARQLAFDPDHARLTAAAVAIEDAGVLPEGWTRYCDGTQVTYRWADSPWVWLTLSLDGDGAFNVMVRIVGGGLRGRSADDPLEAAVAAIAATTEGAS